MMTSSNGNIFRITDPLSPLNSPHKGQWRGALIFSLILAWTNSWVNNREAGDLRRYFAHYDANVMNLTGPAQFMVAMADWATMSFNTLRPRQNGRLFADDTFKRIFLKENILISIKMSLKFIPKGLINNMPALVLTMAWRRPSDKPLSGPMLVRSLTHICVTRPQWVKHCISLQSCCPTMLSCTIATDQYIQCRGIPDKLCTMAPEWLDQQ